MSQKNLGVLLALFGGVFAIGLAIWFSQSSGPLWAIILVAWGLQLVSTSSKVNSSSPLMLGLVLGLAYAGIGVVAYYVHNIHVLWAFLLANWLGSSLVD